MEIVFAMMDLKVSTVKKQFVRTTAIIKAYVTEEDAIV